MIIFDYKRVEVFGFYENEGFWRWKVGGVESVYYRNSFNSKESAYTFGPFGPALNQPILVISPTIQMTPSSKSLLCFSSSKFDEHSPRLPDIGCHKMFGDNNDRVGLVYKYT